MSGLMPEVRRLVLLEALGSDRWRWVDVVTAERGLALLRQAGLEAGDEVVVELHWRGGWVGERFLQLPVTALRLRLEAPLRAVEDVPWRPCPIGWTPPSIGEVRIAKASMDPRSCAARDAGRTHKHRPSVVVWVDPSVQQAGIRFIYGSNSAARRTGQAVRLSAWREAGLRKPTVVALDESIRSFREIGPRIGSLVEPDLRRVTAA